MCVPPRCVEASARVFSAAKHQERGGSRRLKGAPSLDGLGVLGAVVEAGSVVRAGEALGLTQSAVSRVVARLENRIGVRMFRRTARSSISLTNEGGRFYESVAPHLAAIVDATTEASGTSRRVRGRLRVNVDGGVGQFVLTPRLHCPQLALRGVVLHAEPAVIEKAPERVLVADGVSESARDESELGPLFVLDACASERGIDELYTTASALGLACQRPSISRSGFALHRPTGGRSGSRCEPLTMSSSSLGSWIDC